MQQLNCKVVKTKAVLCMSDCHVFGVNSKVISDHLEASLKVFLWGLMLLFLHDD